LRGEWAELESFGDQSEQPDDPSFYGGEFMGFALMQLAIARGDLDGAESFLDRVIGDPEAGDVQTRAFRHLAHAFLANARGDHRTALEEVRPALEHTSYLGIRHEVWKPAFVEALEAALAMGEIERAEEVHRLVTDAPPGAQTPLLRAQAARFGARIAVAKGAAEEVEPGFKAAAGLLRELGTPFLLAQTLFEHGEWLVGQERLVDARPLLEEASATFERLGAVPSLERAQRVAPDLARA
jgi:hypothetical protein